MRVRECGEFVHAGPPANSALLSTTAESANRPEFRGAPGRIVFCFGPAVPRRRFRVRAPTQTAPPHGVELATRAIARTSPAPRSLSAAGLPPSGRALWRPSDRADRRRRTTPSLQKRSRTRRRRREGRLRSGLGSSALRRPVLASQEDPPPHGFRRSTVGPRRFLSPSQSSNAQRTVGRTLAPPCSWRTAGDSPPSVKHPLWHGGDTQHRSGRDNRDRSKAE